MQLRIIIGLCLIVLLACQKFISVEERDVINYFDIKDTLVESIRYCTFNSSLSNCDSVATPMDSSSFIRIDVDHDGQYDFDFKTRQYVDQCTNCMQRRAMETSVNSIHNKASFATVGRSLNAKLFFPGDSIALNETWGGSRTILSSITQCGSVNPNFSDNLWAIKVNGKVGWIHISRTGKNGLIISEWAFNLTEFRGIIAGQRS